MNINESERILNVNIYMTISEYKYNVNTMNKSEYNVNVWMSMSDCVNVSLDISKQNCVNKNTSKHFDDYAHVYAHHGGFPQIENMVP